MPDRVTLKIPRPLYEKLQHVVEGTGYRSVNEFVVHVLRDLVSEVRSPEDSELSNRVIELVKKRLRNLGYLD